MSKPARGRLIQTVGFVTLLVIHQDFAIEIGDDQAFDRVVVMNSFALGICASSNLLRN